MESDVEVKVPGGGGVVDTEEFGDAAGATSAGTLLVGDPDVV